MSNREPLLDDVLLVIAATLQNMRADASPTSSHPSSNCIMQLAHIQHNEPQSTGRSHAKLHHGLHFSSRRKLHAITTAVCTPVGKLLHKCIVRTYCPQMQRGYNTVHRGDDHCRPHKWAASTNCMINWDSTHALHLNSACCNTDGSAPIHSCNWTHTDTESDKSIKSVNYSEFISWLNLVNIFNGSHVSIK